VAGVAAELSERRRLAAKRLEREVESALHLLELPHARFRVTIERRADPAGVEIGGALLHCGPAGIDDVQFRLATNRGSSPAPLDEGPSGGELSRLVLALAACITETGSPLLVLDEVDAGIGGETAARVGDLLAAAGRQRQVVAVTHRAEIASRADGHLVVRKEDMPRGSVAHVEAVDGEHRLEEIARLMSGRVTDAALARAVELRGEAVETIASGASPLARRTRSAGR
jgi:DNA repair protein RecN (Recombination protein N)